MVHTPLNFRGSTEREWTLVVQLTCLLLATRYAVQKKLVCSDQVLLLCLFFRCLFWCTFFSFHSYFLPSLAHFDCSFLFLIKMNFIASRLLYKSPQVLFHVHLISPIMPEDISYQANFSHLYLVHVELAPCIALIHCAIHRFTACAIDFSWGFWYGTLPCPITFKGAKLLATSTSAVEWYKSRAHTLFLSQVTIMCQLKCEQGIVVLIEKFSCI